MGRMTRDMGYDPCEGQIYSRTCQWVPWALFLGLKQTGHEAECLCLSSATVDSVKMCIWSSVNIYVMAVNCVPELRTRTPICLYVHCVFSFNGTFFTS